MKCRQTPEVTQFQSDGAWSLPSGQGWPFFLSHHRRGQWLNKWYLVWSWQCKTWWKGSGGSRSCNDLSRRSPRLWDWCLPGDDSRYDGVGTWQRWHFKVRPYWGQSSGRPVTAEELSEGYSCDTLFGLISRCTLHPVVQVLLSEKQQITNEIRIGRTILHVYRLEWQRSKETSSICDEISLKEQRAKQIMF